MPRTHRAPRKASASCNTQEVNVVTCRQLQEEALHPTLVVPRENHTVGGGHGCRFDNFSLNDWVAPQLGLSGAELDGEGETEQERCLYIKATREKFTWGDSVRH